MRFGSQRWSALVSSVSIPSPSYPRSVSIPYTARDLCFWRGQWLLPTTNNLVAAAINQPVLLLFFYRCSFNGLRVRFYGSLSWWQRAISPLSTDFCPTGTVLSFFRTNGSRARHLSILTTLLSDFDSSQSFSSRFRGAFGRYMTYIPPSRPKPRLSSDPAKTKSRPILNMGHRCRTRWKTR